jgi:hypothetical protein
MSELRRLIREEWWTVTAVFGGIVLWAMWQGVPFFESVNTIILSSVCAATSYAVWRLVNKRR